MFQDKVIDFGFLLLDHNLSPAYDLTPSFSLNGKVARNNA